MAKKPKDNCILAYYQQISSGAVCVGKWIQLQYERIIKGLQDKELFFDQVKADKAINWIETHCFHTEGPLAPQCFKMELWQKALISTVFGIVDENGQRVAREVVLIVARKNGKSKLFESICRYIWQCEGGYGARVYCVAPKLDQADIIYSAAWQSTQLDPEWQALKTAVEGSKNDHNKKTIDDSGLARHRMSDLFIPATNAIMKKIAFSAKKSDGFNPSLTVCDEIASWEGDKGLKQYEVMKSAMGARDMGESPALLMSCSTAGYVNDSIYDELLKRSTRLLMGDSKEKRLFPFLYMIDDVARWDDINELRKSNPNLGVSVSVNYLLEEIAIANGSLSKRAEFIVKYCNIKQNSSIAWLQFTDVEKACGEHLSLEDFRGCYCVGGIDLSQTTDLTSACVVIEKGGKLYILSKFWMPAERLEIGEAEDSTPYRLFEKQGLLTLSGDNFVDYHNCFAWFKSLVEEYEIYPLQIGYDRYSAQYLVQEMTEYGFHMDDVFQGFNLSPVIKEFEGLLKDGNLQIGDNQLLKAHLLNTALKMDNESNKCKLVKLGKRTRIDGCAALIDAMTVRQKWWTEIGSQLQNEVS